MSGRGRANGCEECGGMGEKEQGDGRGRGLGGSGGCLNTAACGQLQQEGAATLLPAPAPEAEASRI